MAKDKTVGKVRKDIDENLKRVYDDIVAQDVPDRFKHLLEQLKSRESKPQGEAQ